MDSLIRNLNAICWDSSDSLIGLKLTHVWGQGRECIHWFNLNQPDKHELQNQYKRGRTTNNKNKQGKQEECVERAVVTLYLANTVPDRPLS
jgi:hypothetical protein